MTASDRASRRPRVFAPDDPAIAPAEGAPAPGEALSAAAADPAAEADPAGAPAARRPVRWGAILLSALGGLLVLAATTLLVDFAAAAVTRGSWLGQAVLVLAAIALLAAAAILVRELAGLLRLARLSRLRDEIEAALASKDAKREKAALQALLGALEQRPEARWAIARFRRHEAEVTDPGDLARLADREVFAGLDRRARRTVLAAAKRVGVVTALSPMPLIDVLYVSGENLRMLRTIATIYGGRPGLAAAARLGRMVITHIVATGGLALTDDLIGQVLGQDLIRRLSRRLGEGAVNGALTARIGAAAILVMRPLPFIETPPVRARDILAELFRAPAGARPRR